MATIRPYLPSDAPQVARLIRDTYREFNLDFLNPTEQAAFLGPFQYADSALPEHQQALRGVIASEMVFVAEEGGRIVGVLRGRLTRLGSLFVSKEYHRQGIASSLVRHFEGAVRNRGGQVIRVASSLYAVPFYQRMGYKKSTGVRSGVSFDGRGLPIQPMRKVLENMEQN